MAEWENVAVRVEKGVNSMCKHSEPSVTICLSDRCPLWKRNSFGYIGCYPTLAGWLCVFLFCLHLQFQNNNNYMNMAEANGALLAAGDVSILHSFLCKNVFWTWEIQQIERSFQHKFSQVFLFSYLSITKHILFVVKPLSCGVMSMLLHFLILPSGSQFII